MESLIRLEEALLEENSEGVTSYLSEIDRKTANECMKIMGESLGFKTIEINGVFYAHLGRTSEILGYGDPSSLAQLLRRYQIMTPKIGWFEDETRIRIRNIFNLDPKDGQATFIPYEGILIAGMQGQTEGAKKIKLYLLKTERAFRVSMGADQVKAEELSMKKEVHRIKVLKEKLSLITATGVKMPDELKTEFTTITGAVMPEDSQLDMFNKGVSRHESKKTI